MNIERNDDDATNRTEGSDPPSDVGLFECASPAKIKKLLARALPEEEERAVAAHLLECPHCRGIAEHLCQFEREEGEAQEEVDHEAPTRVFDMKSALERCVEGADSRTPTSDDSFTVQQPPVRIGRFELLQRLGSGGFGVVHLARDIVLRRNVALKLPRTSELLDPEQRQRFLREAQAAAGLHHPNIVPVFEAGEVDGICYIASEYCLGPTLARWCRQQERPIPAETAVRIVRALANALEHAHQRGIVHRDVKPGNVLLEQASGNQNTLPFVPKLTDFGTAKLLDEEHTATASGVLLGTPRYMAPEQASGRPDEYGPPTDVYSLGVILYELLTGRPPIKGGDNADTLRRVVTEEPPRLRHLLPGIPRDLEAICLKCLSKSPSGRYATAREMGDDLDRFLSGQPTLARPMGAAELSWRWIHKHPTATGVAATSLLAAVLMMAGLFLHLRRTDALIEELSGLLKQRDAEALRAEQSEQELQQQLYASDIQLADESFHEGDVRAVTDRLQRHRPRRGRVDLRGIEWWLLHHLVHVPSRTLGEEEANVYVVAYSPDGRRFAWAGMAGTIHLHDMDGDQPPLAFDSQQGEVNGLAFSPTENILVSAGDDGTLRFWNLETLTQVRQIPAFERLAFQVAFTPDGSVLASCGADPMIRLWDAHTGEPRGDLEGHQGLLQGHVKAVEAITLSCDGRLLASASGDLTARLWEVESHEARHVWKMSERVTCVDISRDSQWVALGGLSGRVEVRNATTGDLTGIVQHMDAVECVRFDPAANWVASGDRAGVVRLSALRTAGQAGAETQLDPVRVWSAHTGRVWSLAFSQEGEPLVTSGEDGAVREWNDLSPARVQLSGRGAVEIREVAFLPSDRIIGVHREGVTLWDLQSRQSPQVLPTTEGGWDRVIVAPKLGWIIAGNQQGRVQLWDMDTLEGAGHWSHWRGEAGEEISQLAVSESAGLLFVRTSEKCVVLSLPSLQPVDGFPGDYNNCQAVSPDGHWLAIGTNPGDQVDVWDIRERRRAVTFPGHDTTIRSLGFSPDSRWLASGSSDRLIKLWDLKARELNATLMGHRAELEATVFAPDGRSLVSVAQDHTARIWNIEAAQELLRLPLDRNLEWVDAAISPDGHYLAVLAHSGEVVVFKATTAP